MLKCGFWGNRAGTAWIEQEIEEGADAWGFLEGRGRWSGGGDPARSGRVRRARRQGASPAGRVPARRGAGPNVILVIIDTLRRDHVGAYGNPWIQTPNLDALAEESLLFTRAHPEAMPTLPARRAIHTGMRTWPTRPPSYGWKSIPAGQTTWPRRSRGRASAPTS